MLTLRLPYSSSQLLPRSDREFACDVLIEAARFLTTYIDVCMRQVDREKHALNKIKAFQKRQSNAERPRLAYARGSAQTPTTKTGGANDD
jgi:hypothetical protein